MNTRRAGAVTAALLFLASIVGAQGIATGDVKFIQKVEEAGRAEVELGRLAVDKAVSEPVKQFAQRMIEDHGRAATELADLAARKGVPVPNELSGTHMRLRDWLARLQGPVFDREYIKVMEKDHKQDVAEFRRMSRQAGDPDLKAWVDRTLPILEEHLKLVESLRTQVSAAR
jgi:putative membrane protein